MNRAYRGAWAVFAAVLLLSGCGSRSLSPEPAARLADQAITWQDVHSHVSYAARFYAPSAPHNQCMGNDVSAFCRALSRQVLERLIEERVIQAYARRHRIALTAAERRRATRMIALLSRKAVPGGRASGQRNMLTSIVRRELLVQRVQAAVTAAVPVSGLSYHLRRYLVPTFASAHQTYLKASHLALGGSPPPAGTRIRTTWTAAFLIARSLRVALREAQPGQYLGPFKRAGGYEVILLLGHARRMYGAGAHASLAARRFATWLRAQVLAAHPICYNAHSKAVSCPLPSVPHQ